MDEHGLPIVGAGVDYTKVPALDHKNTLVFLNKFIMHTTQFLNRFSTVCEERLAELSRRIQRLDISLNILEAKLSSIPDLEGVTASAQYEPPAAVASAGSTTAAAAASSSSSTTTAAAAPPTTSGPIPAPSTNEPIPPPQAESEAAEQSKGRKARDDPRYQKYFKMKRLGVNPLQIAMEMKRHGLNPDIVENEDAVLPESDGAGGGGGGGVDASYGGGRESDSDSSSVSSEDSNSSFGSD